MSIKEKIEQQFIADFDLDILLKFVEDKLTKCGEVNIGLVNDRENNSLKSKPFKQKDIPQVKSGQPLPEIIITFIGRLIVRYRIS